MEIYPSLISSDILGLKKTIDTLDNYCDGYHLDVMDNHFVPNLTWGAGFINAIRKASKLPLHIHLMVENPDQWIERLILRKGDTFIFHIEALPEEKKQKILIARLHAKGILAGIALNPLTDIEKSFGVIEYLSSVLIMSVNPGFSGQEFISDVTKKIEPLLAMKTQINTLLKIGMDGGINKTNITSLAHQHIDFVGVASAIFSEPDPVHALQELYKLAQ